MADVHNRTTKDFPPGTPVGLRSEHGDDKQAYYIVEDVADDGRLKLRSKTARIFMNVHSSQVWKD